MSTESNSAPKLSSELQIAVQDVLEPGETLASFTEQSVRLNIENRLKQKTFISKGLASRDEARQTGEYYSAEAVEGELDRMLEEAETRARK